MKATQILHDLGQSIGLDNISQDFHVGPHMMVVSPHQDDFQGFNRDGSNGMPYVAHLPNHTELYLVIPIRQWDE